MNSSGGLTVRAFVPTPSIPAMRGNLYYVIENTNPVPMTGISSMVAAMDGNGRIYLLQPPTLIEANAQNVPQYPAGTVPPGTSAGSTICIDWPQFGTPQVNFLVALLNQAQQPLATALVPGFFMAPGTIVPAATQAVDLLGPGVRLIAGFPAGATPKYEGSVNAVGYEDTYVFTAQRSTVSIVVKISADAQQMKFKPVMRIYDVEDMSTPLVTHSSRFQAGGVDVDPTTHTIGWRDNDHVLTVGNKYAITITHEAAFYSRRWDFQIFHEEQIVQTGGNISIVDGLLDGELSCSYGRQAVKILNTRTDQAIFVETNERGVTYDLQHDTTEGTAGRTLAVSYGDILEVIRPGPGVLYRRHGDLIGRIQL